MTCVFCERRGDYLRAKHCNYCPMCAAPLHERAARAKPKPKPKQREGGCKCPECGKPVRRSDPRAVYCSVECQRRHNNRRQRERKKARA